MKHQTAPERLDDILYPELSPYDSGLLPVTSTHQVYFEQSGNPEGRPLVFVHGGPGAATTPLDRRYFNPDTCRIIMFDQRGCGKSLFADPLEDNDTWALVKDLESLREFLGIQRWTVVGGSWGSTLSLVYSITHPGVVDKLVVHGVFLLTPPELEWAYQNGANHVFTDQYRDLLSILDDAERGDPLAAYESRLKSEDENLRITAARKWDAWEGWLSFMDQEYNTRESSDREKYLMSLIETHYFTRGGFLPSENFILENTDRLQGIPCYIIQGRFDMICPLESAWRLSQSLNNCSLEIVDAGGHAKQEPAMAKSIVQAANALRPV